MKVLGFVLVNLFHFSICEFIKEGYMAYEIELDVFSGRPSPHWIVDKKDKMYSKIAAGLSKSKSTRMSDKLGYRGFVVEIRNPFGQRMVKSIGAGSKPKLEKLLLKSSKKSSPHPIEASVRRHVIDTITGSDQKPPKYVSLRSSLSARPRLPVRSCRLPRFDPENWNFPPTIRRNNCYNYATRRQTDTFAKPGRASGRVFSRHTAVSLLRASRRDGLIPLPFFDPRMFQEVCYTALVVWPDTDFHFYRLDSNMLWSHKPGKTPARNTDNSGDLIDDPRFADRGNYVIFAGYLGNHPGVRVL